MYVQCTTSRRDEMLLIYCRLWIFCELVVELVVRDFVQQIEGRAPNQSDPAVAETAALLDVVCKDVTYSRVKFIDSRRHMTAGSVCAN